MQNLKTLIEQRLIQSLSPSTLIIEDQSHLHVGHAGAKQGGKHIKITIAASDFLHQSQVTCHRLVYDVLKDLIGHEIHAVQIFTIIPTKTQS